MWCVGKHPLILGYDLGNPKCRDCTGPTDIIDILLNKDLIAINQDPLGKPVSRMAQNGCADPVPAPPHPRNFHQKVVTVWAGPLAGGAHVAMLLNAEGNSTGGADATLDCATVTFDAMAALGVPHGTALSWYTDFGIIFHRVSRLFQPCTAPHAPCGVRFLVAVRAEC